MYKLIDEYFRVSLNAACEIKNNVVRESEKNGRSMGQSPSMAKCVSERCKFSHILYFQDL